MVAEVDTPEVQSEKFFVGDFVDWREFNEVLLKHTAILKMLKRYYGEGPFVVEKIRRPPAKLRKFARSRQLLVLRRKKTNEKVREGNSIFNGPKTLSGYWFKKA